MERKINFLVTPLLFFLCFSIYFITLSPDITWAHFSESGAKLLLQIYNRSLNFPSRHFFYLLFAKLYLFFIRPLQTNLPFAFLFNLFSAILASLTIALFYLLLTSLFPKLKTPPHLPPANLNYLPPLFGSLLLAFSPTFWSQALVTSTSSFYLFFFTLFLFSILKMKKGGKRRVFLLLIFSSFVLFSSIFPGDLPKQRRSFSQFCNNFSAIISLTWRNFSPTLIILASLGLFFSLEKSLIFLTLSISVGQIAFDSLFQTSTTPPFFLPTFAIISLWISGGVKVVLEIILALVNARLAVSFDNQFFLLIFRLKQSGEILKYLVLGIGAFLLLLPIERNLKYNYPYVNLRQEQRALNFGQKAFSVLPKNSLVFCETEKICFTLQYFQKVVYKKEIEIQPFSDKTEAEIRKALAKRPVFFALAKFPAGQERGYWKDFVLISKGPLYQLFSPH